MALLNTVAGKAFKIASQDVVIGTSIQQADGSWAFTAGGDRPNAVRVNTKMTQGSASGPVTLAFARVFNVRNLHSNTKLDRVGDPAGDLPFDRPFGVDVVRSQRCRLGLSIRRQL